jgi:hypothetical protein
MLQGAQLDGVHAGSVPGIVIHTWSRYISRKQTHCSPYRKYRATEVDSGRLVQICLLE